MNTLSISTKPDRPRIHDQPGLLSQQLTVMMGMTR